MENVGKFMIAKRHVELFFQYIWWKCLTSSFRYNFQSGLYVLNSFLKMWNIVYRKNISLKFKSSRESSWTIISKWMFFVCGEESRRCANKQECLTILGKCGCKPEFGARNNASVSSVVFANFWCLLSRRVVPSDRFCCRIPTGYPWIDERVPGGTLLDSFRWKEVVRV